MSWILPISGHFVCLELQSIANPDRLFRHEINGCAASHASKKKHIHIQASVLHQNSSIHSLSSRGQQESLWIMSRALKQESKQRNKSPCLFL